MAYIEKKLPKDTQAVSRMLAKPDEKTVLTPLAQTNQAQTYPAYNFDSGYNGQLYGAQAQGQQTPVAASVANGAGRGNATQMLGPAPIDSTAVNVWDPSGNAKTGYILDGSTYLDPWGVQGIESGYTVQTTNGDLYRKTDSGSDFLRNINDPAKTVKIWDANGKEGTGYLINGETYLDDMGFNRIGQGYKVQLDNGDIYQMGANGGELVSTNRTTDENGNYIPESSPWYRQAKELMDQLNNMAPYQFDPNNSVLWQSLVDQYTNSGQQAMRDTMGQAAGLTGGYGSSYSQAAGQQAYNEYLQKLSAAMPDVYQQERQAYQDDRDAAYQKLNMALGMYDRDLTAWENAQNRAYQRERDAVEDAWRKTEYDASREDTAWNQKRTEALDAENKAQKTLENQWKEEDRAAERKQQEITNALNKADLSMEEYKMLLNQTLDLLDRGYMVSDELLTKFGIAKEDAQRRVNAVQNSYISTGGSGGSGSRGRSSGGRGSGGGGGYDYDYDTTLAEDEQYLQERRNTMADAYSQLSSYGKNVVSWYENGDYRGPLQGETLRQYILRMYENKSQSVSDHDLPLIKAYYNLQ